MSPQLPSTSSPIYSSTNIRQSPNPRRRLLKNRRKRIPSAILGLSVWNSLHVKIRMLWILRQLLHFWKMCAPKLKKLIVPQLVKKFPAYYATRKFLTCLQQTNTGPYSKLHKFNSHPSIQFLYFFPVLLQVSRLKACMHPSSPLHVPHSLPIPSSIWQA